MASIIHIACSICKAKFQPILTWIQNSPVCVSEGSCLFCIFCVAEHVSLLSTIFSLCSFFTWWGLAKVKWNKWYSVRLQTFTDQKIRSFGQYRTVVYAARRSHTAALILGKPLLTGCSQPRLDDCRADKFWCYPAVGPTCLSCATRCPWRQPPPRPLRCSTDSQFQHFVVSPATAWTALVARQPGLRMIIKNSCDNQKTKS